MFRVLISEPLHPEGEALLKTETEVDVRLDLTPDELLASISDYDALVVRSETKVTENVLKAGQRLQVVGRAGVGVDNIDLDAATRLGITVVNAPTGNTVAAAEHTVALMLSLARNIPQAHQSLVQGNWARSMFVGSEVREKVLGIVGLGRVGSEVALRARGLQMKLIGYDPFVTPEHAQRLGIRLVSFEELLSESDFVTLHTPMTDNTRHLIGEKELQLVKPSARLINCARGSLIDEKALLTALKEERIAGVALDVFAEEPPGDNPLLLHPNVVATPHLGASTTEAQAEVGRQAAEQILLVLKGEPAPYTANVFFAIPETQRMLAPYVPVSTTIAKLATQLVEGQLTSVTIRYQGEIAQHDTSMLKAAVLAGVLEPITSSRVNLVNSVLLASQRGLRVVEEKSDDDSGHYGSVITVEMHTSQGTTSVSGTVMRGESHIVKIEDYWVDIVPSTEYLLFTYHQDHPGLIGSVGTITGAHDINISFMEVARLAPRGNAAMILGLDDLIPEPVMEELRSIPLIGKVKLVRV